MSVIWEHNPRATKSAPLPFLTEFCNYHGIKRVEKAVDMPLVLVTFHDERFIIIPAVEIAVGANATPAECAQLLSEVIKRKLGEKRWPA